MSPGKLLAQLFDPADAGRLFDDRARLQGILDFEAALARAQERLGVILSGTAGAIATKCRVELFDLEALARGAAVGGNPAIPAVKQPARYRVLRYDRRRHGRSEAPEGPYTIEMLGRDALAVLDAAGIDSTGFCGLSKGGMAGQWLGVNAPRRVERLVLANTSSFIGASEVWNQRIETVRTQDMAAIVPGVIDRWFTRPFQERASDSVARIRSMLLATDPRGYAACCAAVRDMDQREAIRTIAAPTLVIAGRHDQATPPEQARLLAQSIPGTKLIELDAAHLSNIEAEAAFTRVVLDFLG